MLKTIKGVVEGNVVVPEAPAIVPEGVVVTIDKLANKSPLVETCWCVA